LLSDYKVPLNVFPTIYSLCGRPLEAALSVAVCLSVCLSVPCLRFSRKGKVVEIYNLVENMAG